MFSIYLFSLVFGAVLIVSSLVMGSDGDADVDADASIDVDTDAALDGAADAGQQGFETEHGDAHGTLGGFAGAFLSIRFWTYFLCFGGLAGAMLTTFEAADVTTTGITAALTGLIAGQGTVALFRLVNAHTVHDGPGSRAYVGKSARVLLPAEAGDLAKIRVELEGTTMDYLAKATDGTSLAADAVVMIVGFEDATALVIEEAKALASTPSHGAA